MVRAESYNAALIELADLIGEAEAIGERLHQKDMRPRPGHEDVAAFIAGWYQHIRYTWEAAKTLLDERLPHAVDPLLRLMLEDAISAQLVARNPVAWESILSKANDSEDKLFQAMRDADVVPPKEFEAWLNSLPPKAPPGYGEFKHMSNRFQNMGGDGDRLLYLWNRFTQMSHGNVNTAMLFLEHRGPEDPPALSTEPQWSPDILHVYGAALDCLLLGAEALSLSLDGDPLRDAGLAVHARKAALEDRLLAEQAGADAPGEP